MAPRSTLETYAALLRGINVGGKSIIKMRDLVESFERMRFKDVRTYIQSGNVIFRTKANNPRTLEKNIEKMLAKDHKIRSKVVICDHKKMKAIVKSIPKKWANEHSYRHNVLFLRHTIDSKKILGGLKPKPKIEEVVYRPGVLFWSARIGDLTRTSMVKLSAQKIYQEMTIRNLNTTKKMFELMQKGG